MPRLVVGMMFANLARQVPLTLPSQTRANLFPFPLAMVQLVI